jgi:glutamyl-tRNA synthetase
MDWGNAIVRSISRGANGDVTNIDMDLYLAGDFKSTEKKITWLAKPTTEHLLVQATLLDYDYLVQKRKLEKDDTVESVKTEQTEFSVDALADLNVLDLKERDIIQFERKGYFILDSVESVGAAKNLRFIRIPDGRAAGIALKAPGATTTASPGDKSTPATATPHGIDYTGINMYKVDPVNKVDEMELPKGMYKVDNVYGEK